MTADNAAAPGPAKVRACGASAWPLVLTRPPRSPRRLLRPCSRTSFGGSGARRSPASGCAIHRPPRTSSLTRAVSHLQLDLRRPTLAKTSGRRASRRRSLFRDNDDDDTAPGVLKLGPLSAAVMLGVMQMWELGREVPVAPGKRARKALDAGFGAVYDASSNSVMPVARLRCRVPPWLPFAPDAVIRLMPVPEAVIKGSWPIPFTQGLRVGAALLLPWTNEQFDALALGASIPWKPQFRCRVYSSGDRGPVQFSSRGLELAEQSLRLGRDTVLRVAATVDLPREFPLPEDEPPFRLNLDKLAIKSRLRYLPYVA